MSSQSDDFARMIQLLEEILLELRHNRPVQPYYPAQPSYPMVGCSLCGNLQYSCNRMDCPSRITYAGPIVSSTMTFETCRCGGHGSCQCGVAE